MRYQQFQIKARHTIQTRVQTQIMSIRYSVIRILGFEKYSHDIPRYSMSEYRCVLLQNIHI